MTQDADANGPDATTGARLGPGQAGDPPKKNTGLRLWPPSPGFATSVAVLVIIVVAGGICTWLWWPKPVAHVTLGPPAASRAHCAAQATGRPVKVNIASGPGAILNIIVGRNGQAVTGHSAPLAIHSGLLCPGEILSVTASDFVSSGSGPALTSGQFASWAKVDQYGTHITIFVEVAPRNTEQRHWSLGQLSDFGGYSGTVSLNDRRAAGATMAVHVHVLYPDLGLVFTFGFLAAFGGFIWAWLVHRKVAGNELADRAEADTMLRNLILRGAVLLAATVPVVNLQVLEKPDWAGTLSQYIALGTLVGAAAVAATPTFFALVMSHTKEGQ